MYNPFKIIHSLFVEGGVEIVTLDVARTVIQPDADVLNKVSNKILNNPDAEATLRLHFQHIKEFLDTLNGIKRFLDWGFWLLAVVIWIDVIIRWLQEGKLKTALVVQIVFGLFWVLAKPMMICLVRKYLSYRIGKVL